jgi:hypothetical protein
MIDFLLDDSEVKAMMERLDNMGKYIEEQDYDSFLRFDMKPLKERIRVLQPKSINSKRYSYSSAQINIEKYGTLESALGIAKQRNKENDGEHAFFTGYSQGRGRKAYVSVFLNYGTGSPNFLKKLGFLQQAELDTKKEVTERFLLKAQEHIDIVLKPYT